MVKKCGEHIQIKPMETVESGRDWREREKFWIAALRVSFPGGTNVADGGQGCFGMVMPESTKRKIGAANRGKSPSPETRAKMRKAKAGKKQSPEHVANMRAAVAGKPKSESHRKALREAWVRRRGRAAIMAYHGADVFERCGIAR
jgi:hypothetical protein